MTTIPQNQQIQTPIPVQSAGEDGRINFGRLFSTLWRGKWDVTLITLLSIIVGGHYVYVAATPFCRSTVVVILETRQDSIVDMQRWLAG